MLGGLGVCGRPCCCNSFLGEFQPVSIKMAKEQGLSLSPVKISGTCGRLMCCLKYEQEAYTDLIKKTPKVGATVKTPEGKGTVVDTALLTGTIKVKLDSTPSEAAPHVYNIKEIRPLGKNFPTENIEEEPLLEEELTDDLAKLEEEEIVAKLLKHLKDLTRVNARETLTISIKIERTTVVTTKTTTKAKGLIVSHNKESQDQITETKIQTKKEIKTLNNWKK